MVGGLGLGPPGPPLNLSLFRSIITELLLIRYFLDVSVRSQGCGIRVSSSSSLGAYCGFAVGRDDCTADIVFALDTSGSIDEQNFQRVVQFVGSVVQSLVIRTDQKPNGFQVALVSFADRVDVRFHLNTFTNKELMLAAINIPYTRGRTNLSYALRCVLSTIQL